MLFYYGLFDMQQAIYILICVEGLRDVKKNTFLLFLLESFISPIVRHDMKNK